jgi:hypothetical protein
VISKKVSDFEELLNDHNQLIERDIKTNFVFFKRKIKEFERIDTRLNRELVEKPYKEMN